MSNICEKYSLKISDENIEYLKKMAVYFDEDNKTYLLNSKHVQYNIMEKIVFDIAMFHLANKNVLLNKPYFIEFGIHDKGDTLFKTQQLNIDGNMVTPIFSSILHLTDNNRMEPIVYTNITAEEYMFKEFSNTSLHLSFPQKKKQIVFDGNIYYSSNLSDDFVLVINIWDVFPMITFFDNVICDFVLYKNTHDECFNNNKTIIDKESETIVQIQYDNKSDNVVIGSWGIITDKFLENILYNKDKNNIHVYNDLFKLITFKSSDILFKQNIDNEVKSIEVIEAIKAIEAINVTEETEPIQFVDSVKSTKSINVIEAIEPIQLVDSVKSIEVIHPNKLNETSQNTKKRININETKFIQRPIIYNKFQKELCDWIIRECENITLTNEMWVVEKSIQFIQVDKIIAIFPFILDSFIESINNICECYSLEKNTYTFHIEDVYISKLDYASKNENDSLFYKKHDNDILLNIALNDDFENGGILFDDNITTYLKKGNMLIFNGNTKYNEYNISGGIKYNLIAHINIFENK
jgi:hypothetical protein